MGFLFSILITAAVFFLLILFLSANPKVSKKITIISLTIAVVSGLLIYGYGYYITCDNIFLAILKAIFSVCESFVGNNNYNDISAAPLMQNEWMQIVCVFVQLCALYTTASAVINTFAAKALKRFRLWFSRFKKINLIYGVNNDSLAFGKELIAKKDGIVIFVDKNAQLINTADINELGYVLLTDSHAIHADCKFLSKIGLSKNRKLSLYALDKNSNNNIQYATKLLNSLELKNISPSHLSLVLIGQEEIAITQLQYTPQKYGYGFVTVINEAQMAARLLTAKYPPCNTIVFDKNGKATNDFHALLIGFGHVGQAALKSIVMNGQFEGSSFKLDVVEPKTSKIDGNFTAQYGYALNQYNVSFFDFDARSRQMYDYLRQNVSSLSYIVISIGSENTGNELAEEIISFFNTIGKQIPVYKCTKQGVDAYNFDGTVKHSYSLYTTETLCSNELDEKAMLLNHKYQNKVGNTPLQNWMECDYFSRLSCRAATDFIPAIIRSAGKNESDVCNGEWNLTTEQIENLSKTEHLRWCAFHYCMGFKQMDSAEFDSRAKIYCEQLEKDGRATIRINKDMVARTHACLIPWEELDELSKKESIITGKEINYKQMDTDNIMTIPEILKTNQ